MTKKKEQKSQKDTTSEVNEEVLSGSEELEDLKSQLEEAQQSVKENWDKLLRSQAEMENLKSEPQKI